MTKTKAEAIVSEVSSRLDDLFGKTEKTGPSLNDKDLIAPQESPILDLNAIVLSIEWEITDEILARFIDEISRLKTLYNDDLILSSFLKLHGSVGKYLSIQKVNAHPDSIRLLQSLFVGFEKVVNSPEMKDVEKKKILSAEVTKFKQLREQVLLAPKGVPPKKDIKPADEAMAIFQEQKPVSRKIEKVAVASKPAAEKERETPLTAAADITAVEEPTAKKDLKLQDLAAKAPLAAEANLMASQELFDHIREEIRKIIKAEFRSLKDELRLLIEG